MGYKFLVVGDPHARVEDLDECRRLIEYVAETAATTTRLDRVIFMGDLYHNHEVVRLEVSHFWRWALELVGERASISIIRGNHDGPLGADPGVNALWAHESGSVQVIDRPQMIRNCGDVFFAVPYTEDRDSFVDVCCSYPTKTLYCHQSFDGAQFENGFYDPHGVDAKKIPQKTIISGHIHRGQEFDTGSNTVWYVGSPRWMTASDANQDKAIWLVEHDDEGAILKKTPFDTRGPCRRILKLVDEESKPLDPLLIDPIDRLYVDVKGSPEWIESRKPVWRGRARWRALPVSQRVVSVRESEGVGKALRKYLSAYKAIGGTSTEVLEGMVSERLPGFAE